MNHNHTSATKKLKKVCLYNRSSSFSSSDRRVPSNSPDECLLLNGLLPLWQLPGILLAVSLRLTLGILTLSRCLLPPAAYTSAHYASISPRSPKAEFK